MKALKRRIVSVNNTQQIMKAMNLVAASKVQKYRTRMEAVRPLFNEAKEFLSQGIFVENAAESVFFSSRPAKKIAYVIMSGERSLCGSYNANVLKAALAHIDGNVDKTAQIIAIGAKCREYFVRRSKKVVANFPGVLENVSYSVAEDVCQKLMAMYTDEDVDNRVDEIYVVYTHFETLLSQVPQVKKLLPFEPFPQTSQREIIYEPDVDTYLRKSVPIYLSMFIYGAMVEASVCEQAARMTSMDAASRNAGEIADKLTLQYNRQRQGAITQEISEIVGGASAI
jgi:F-type H+-transporting ATPase subunit gamma